MSAERSNSVILKKALTGREEFDARAMSHSKAIRLSLERSSDRLFDLALTVRTVEQRKVQHGDLAAVIGEDKLLILLDGNQPWRGAAALDRAFVQSLLEMQTRGRVSDTEQAERAFTNTDAAISAPLLNEVLSGLDHLMAEDAPQAQPWGLQFGDRVEDVRALALMLDAPEFQVFKLTLDIARGARTGEIAFCIPADFFQTRHPATGTDGAAPDHFYLGDLAMTAPVTLDAVLDRVRLPLSKVALFKPGMTLPISATSLKRTELLAAQRHMIAYATLGQLNGFRAVRLIAAEEGLAELPDATPLERGAVEPAPVEDKPVAPAQSLVPEYDEPPQLEEPLADIELPVPELEISDDEPIEPLALPELEGPPPLGPLDLPVAIVEDVEAELPSLPEI